MKQTTVDQTLANLPRLINGSEAKAYIHTGRPRVYDAVADCK